MIKEAAHPQLAPSQPQQQLIALCLRQLLQVLGNLV